MGVKIIYEDKDIIAVNKPPGINTHSDGRGDISLADEILKIRPEIKNTGEDSARPGVVHRLDRDTSGVLIFAKNNKNFEYLKNLFKRREIKKTYLTAVLGKLGNKIGEQGIIKLPIARSAKIPMQRTAGGATRGARREAETDYKILKYFKFKNADGKEHILTLIEARPKTGRTHQIRAHFKALGTPLAGDKLYGNKKLNEKLALLGLTRQALHALSLEFNLPSGGRIKIEAGLPDDLKNFFGEIGKIGTKLM